MTDIAKWIANFDPTTQLVVGAIYYLAAAMLLASVIDLLVKLGARYGINEVKRPILHFILKIIRVPLAWSVILLGINFTIAQLALSPWLSNLVVQVSQTVTIIVWGQAIYRIIRFTLKTHCTSSTKIGFLKPQTLPLFDNLASIAMVMLGLYFIFLTWKIDMTAWLASAGVVGIAVGFAAKDTLANLFSGVFILADSPYEIGDYIVIDSGERGKVTHIGLRSTRMLTRDDLEITVPNSLIANGKIINESKGQHVKSRVRLAVSVAYGSDIDQVRRVLLEEAAEEEGACTSPEPRVRFRRFGGSGLDIELLFWIDDPEIRGRILDLLNVSVYKRFAAEGIEIPYSKHDLYIKQMPAENKLL